jgi:hypothetical protein
MEEQCYLFISASTGVAPRGKRPLTVTSEMQAHQWVNFAKVYGKYLLSRYFEDLPLMFIAELLDVVRICLSSTINQALLQELIRKRKNIAELFDKTVPGTEKSIMLHLLLWHMPDTIAYWGPARGYWCFPFERSASTTKQSVCLHLSFFVIFCLLSLIVMFCLLLPEILVVWHVRSRIVSNRNSTL